MSCCEESVGLPAAKCALFIAIGAAQPNQIYFNFSSWLQFYHILLLLVTPLTSLSEASCQWALSLNNILSMTFWSPVAALQLGRKTLDGAGGNLNKGLWIICLWYLCTASTKRAGFWQLYSNSIFTFLRKKLRCRLNCFLQQPLCSNRRIISKVHTGIYTVGTWEISFYCQYSVRLTQSPLKSKGIYLVLMRQWIQHCNGRMKT